MNKWFQNRKWAVLLLLWVGGLLLGGSFGWGIGNKDTASYQSQIASLENELAVCEQNYEQVIDVLNEQNITHSLPVDDQIANILEFMTDNGTIKYDIVLNYHIDDDGLQSGDITISLEKGDKVDTD